MKLYKVINKGTETEQIKEYNIEESLDLALKSKISKPLILKGVVDSNNSITFDSLPDGQTPYNAAIAAYGAGQLVQIDVTNPAEDWNTILTLSRVDSAGDLQFFNYEETQFAGEPRLQLIKMFDDDSAIYSYFLVSEDSTIVITGQWNQGTGVELVIPSTATNAHEYLRGLHTAGKRPELHIEGNDWTAIYRLSKVSIGYLVFSNVERWDDGTLSISTIKVSDNGCVYSAREF